MDKDELFELTEIQQKAWNRFRNAVENLKNKDLFFYDNYGTIGVCDGEKINSYNDIENEDGIMDDRSCNINEVISPFGVSWTDDEHWFHPTK